MGSPTVSGRQFTEVEGRAEYIFLVLQDRGFWLTKLLVGENSCEWAAWFRSQHETWSYEKVPSTFDATTWQLNHTSLLNRIQADLEGQGQAVSPTAFSASSWVWCFRST